MSAAYVAHRRKRALSGWNIVVKANVSPRMGSSSDIGLLALNLFLLAIPVACIAWTVTHEEFFRELRQYCRVKSIPCRNILQRTFFYLHTCEYCFSHYVAAFVVVISGYGLLFDDRLGMFTALFSIVWIANLYMSLFAK